MNKAKHKHMIRKYLVSLIENKDTKISVLYWDWFNNKDWVGYWPADIYLSDNEKIWDTLEDFVYEEDILNKGIGEII